MPDYSSIKTAHLILVSASLSLFCLRGYWALNNRLERQGRWVKSLPHVVDTFLLVSGISLVFLSGYSPLNQSWLATKLLLLLCYIALGAFTLNYASHRNRPALFTSTLLVASSMIALALFKPLLW